MTTPGGNSFDASKAYAADPDDQTMGQQQAGPSQGGAQDVTIPASVVGQMQQLKQSGDFQTLGQVVAQLLP